MPRSRQNLLFLALVSVTDCSRPTSRGVEARVASDVVSVPDVSTSTRATTVATHAQPAVAPTPPPALPITPPPISEPTLPTLTPLGSPNNLTNLLQVLIDRANDRTRIAQTTAGIRVRPLDFSANTSIQNPQHISFGEVPKDVPRAACSASSKPAPSVSLDDVHKAASDLFRHTARWADLEREEALDEERNFLDELQGHAVHCVTSGGNALIEVKNGSESLFVVRWNGTRIERFQKAAFESMTPLGGSNTFAALEFADLTGDGIEEALIRFDVLEIPSQHWEIFTADNGTAFRFPEQERNCEPEMEQLAFCDRHVLPQTELVYDVDRWLFRTNGTVFRWDSALRVEKTQPRDPAVKSWLAKVDRYEVELTSVARWIASSDRSNTAWNTLRAMTIALDEPVEELEHVLKDLRTSAAE